MSWMRAKDGLRNVAVGAGVLAFLGFGLWQACFRITNEIGPLGADKSGRQILLQSLDRYFESTIDTSQTGYAVDVGSEFTEVPLWQRLLQEPMRTTFRLSYRIKNRSGGLDSTLVERLLSSPATDFLELYRGPVSLRGNWEVPADSVRAWSIKLGVDSFGELLAAYGFRELRVDVDGRKWISRSLPSVGKGNVKWVGD